MNICFFNTTAFLGGGEKKHLSYALKFKELGHSVVMVVGAGSVLESKCLKHKVEYKTVKLGNTSILNPIKIGKLKAWFREKQIDVVFFNGSKDIKTGGKAATLAKVEHRVYWRGIAVSPKPTRLNQKIFGEYLTQVITNSQETKNKILESLPQAAAKTHVVYNGIDFAAYDSIPNTSDEIPNRTTKLVLGNAARLTKQKAQNILIDLAIRLKKEEIDFEIWIAGEGEEKENIEQLISENGLQDHVKMLGFISNVKAFMSAIDILVFPSLWEGFGFSIVEANACNKPVIGYRISSNPEIIEHKETGVLVDEISSECFVRETLRLIQNDKLRTHISENASARVRMKFDLGNQAQEMLKKVTEATTQLL